MLPYASGRPSPITRVPIELLDRFVRLAAGRDKDVQRTLRFVNRSFNSCALALVFARTHYPSASYAIDPNVSLDFLRNHPHIAGAIRRIIIHNVFDVHHCLQFVRLCEAGRSLHIVEWRLLKTSSTTIIPSIPYAAIGFRSTMLISAAHVAPHVVEWILSEASQLHTLKFAVASFKDTTPGSVVAPPAVGRTAAASLKKFCCWQSTEDASRRLLSNSLCRPLLYQASATLVYLEVAIVAMELVFFQSLIDYCAGTLEVLDMEFLNRGTFILFLAHLAVLKASQLGYESSSLRLSLLKTVRRIVFYGRGAVVGLWADALSSLPCRHVLREVRLHLEDSNVKPDQWKALDNGLARVRNFRKHTIEIDVDDKHAAPTERGSTKPRIEPSNALDVVKAKPAHTVRTGTLVMVSVKHVNDITIEWLFRTKFMPFFGFHYLSLWDLTTLKLLSSAWRTEVLNFLQREGSDGMSLVLNPFFGRGCRELVLNAMARSRAVISGSSALAYFTRQPFTGSDLDFYVSASTYMILVHLLVFHGYVFVPSDHSPALREHTPLHPARSDGYPGLHIRDVYNFVDGRAQPSGRPPRYIQLIIVAWNVIDAILDFHSTIVMNFLSASHAVSFYPLLNFIKKVNLPRDNLNSKGETTPGATISCSHCVQTHLHDVK